MEDDATRRVREWAESEGLYGWEDVPAWVERQEEEEREKLSAATARIAQLIQAAGYEGVVTVSDRAGDGELIEASVDTAAIAAVLDQYLAT